MKKIKLDVGQRLTLTQVIPEKGNFDTMATVEKLKKVLYLSEEEVVEFGLEQGAFEIPKNDHTTKKVDIEVGELGLALIMKSLKKLDDAEELDFFQFNVYKYLKELQEEEKQKEKDK